MTPRNQSTTLQLALMLVLASSCAGGDSSPGAGSGGKSGSGGAVGSGGGSSGSAGSGGSTTPGTGGASSPGATGGSGPAATGGSTGTPAGTGGAGPADAAADKGGGTPDASPPDAVAAACPAGSAFPTLRQTTVAMANGPIDLTGDPADPETAYLLERGGRVREIKGGVLGATPIVTLTGVVTDAERGALGLALHPQFKDNGRMFIFFTKPATTIEEWKVTAGVGTKVKELYSYAHSGGYHQGGALAFGPDNMLYMSVGENHMGGNSTAPDGRLGRVMRLDPDTGMAPATGNLMGLTWSHGLRNPWRMSFDRLTGDFYIADVGQGAQEEIDFEPKGQGGKNYGWPQAEGMLGQGGVRPVHIYGRDGGNSIIGGYVYRGNKYPCLRGHYFYGDNGSNQVRSLFMKDGVATEHKMHATLGGNAGGSIWSFGQDGAGDIYILRSAGRVTRIEAN